MKNFLFRLNIEGEFWKIWIFRVWRSFSNSRREMHRVSLTWCDFPLCRMGYRVLSTDPLEFLHCNQVSGYIATILRSPGHIQRRRRFVLRLDLPFSWYLHATPPSLSFSIDQDFIPLLMQILQLKVPGKSRGTLERERRTVALIKMYALSSVSSPPMCSPDSGIQWVQRACTLDRRTYTR